MAAIHTRDYYRLSPQEALRALNTKKTGLAAETIAGAQAVGVRPPDSHPLAAHYAKQYLTIPTALLALASITAYAFENKAAAAILLTLVFLNVSLSWLQKAKHIQPASPLDVLPRTTTVVRNGDTKSLPLAELATGDIVYLEKGMRAPADIRLIEEDKLFVNDGPLTGNNTPKRKGTQAIQGYCPVTERLNTVLAGSIVTAGNAIGVVYAQGNDTELAASLHRRQIAHPQSSPLYRTIEHMSLWAAISTVGVSAVAIPIALAMDMPHEEALLYTIALLVALLPLSLPTVLQLILTRTRTRLRHHRAVVAPLATIDRLSTINAVISDVSGVLTKQTWKPVYLYAGEQLLSCNAKTGPTSQDNKALTKTAKQHVELLCTAALLTSQSRTSSQQTMEGAIAALANQAGVQLQHIDKLYREIRFFALDAARQRVSSLRYFGDKKSQKPHVFTTGSPEQVLERCTKIWENGKARKLTADDIARIHKQCRQWTKQTLHVIGAAYRAMPATTKGAHLTNDTAEAELIWLGLAAFTNPLREHLANTIAAAQSAYIKLSLITDMPPARTKAIALEAGLARHAKELTVITGESLARLSNTHITHVLQKGNALFVHLSPEDKYRIATLAKQGGKLVALTGRGLVDTPALERADVSVGLTATTTATPPTDLALLDNNFATIVYSIKESRIVSRNLVNVLRAYMTRSLALAAIATTSLVASLLFDIPPALTILQILVFALVIEVFPLAALGRDKPEQDPMRQHAHNNYRSLFSRSALTDTAWTGVFIAGLAYINYILFFGRYNIPAGNVPGGTLLHAKATTLALLIVILCYLIHILQTRSANGLLSKHQLHNRSFWAALLLAITATTALIYNPWVGDFFGTAPLAAIDWGYALGTVVVFAAIRELQRLNKKHSRKAVLELHRVHRLRAKTLRH